MQTNKKTKAANASKNLFTRYKKNRPAAKQQGGSI